MTTAERVKVGEGSIIGAQNMAVWTKLCPWERCLYVGNMGEGEVGDNVPGPAYWPYKFRLTFYHIDKENYARYISSLIFTFLSRLGLGDFWNGQLNNFSLIIDKYLLSLLRFICLETLSSPISHVYHLWSNVAAKWRAHPAKFTISSPAALMAWTQGGTEALASWHWERAL